MNHSSWSPGKQTVTQEIQWDMECSFNARSFAKVLFYVGGGKFKCALGQDVPPPSQTSSSGTTETTSGWEYVLDSAGPGLQSPLCSLLSWLALSQYIISPFLSSSLIIIWVITDWALPMYQHVLSVLWHPRSWCCCHPHFAGEEAQDNTHGH